MSTSTAFRRVCHGVAILKFAKLSNGEYLEGKTVTGFANVEQDFADNAVWSMNLLSRDKHPMPWRIEDALKQSGCRNSSYPRALQGGKNFVSIHVAHALEAHVNFSFAVALCE
jgi:putative intracellular protease/amidase